MNELWKDIPNYEGLYQASNMGNIRSLDKIVPKWNKPYKRKIKGRVLKKHKANGGYNVVALHKNKNQKTYKVSRLIGITWKDNPDNKPEINHKNSIRTDDRAENIEWCTRSENVKHSYDKGNANQKGEKNAYSKLTKKKVLSIRDKYDSGKYSQIELSDMFNISKTTIHNVVKRKTWNHLP